MAALDAHVDPHRIPEFAPTGLQVHGGDGDLPVAKAALAVSAGLDLFDAAASWGANAWLVHHGLFWRSDDL